MVSEISVVRCPCSQLPLLSVGRKSGFDDQADRLRRRFKHVYDRQTTGAEVPYNAGHTGSPIVTQTYSRQARHNGS